MNEKLWESVPPISDILIKAMEETFPDRCPHLGQDVAEVWFNAGRADVVKFLKSVQENQHNVLFVPQDSQASSSPANPGSARVVGG